MNSQPDIGKTDPYAELPALTGLRGFAALWVLLYHVWAMSSLRRVAWRLNPPLMYANPVR